MLVNITTDTIFSPFYHSIMGWISVSSFIPHDPLGLISFKISSRIASAFEQHPVLHIFIAAVIKTFFSVSLVFIKHQFATHSTLADETTFQQAPIWCDHYTRRYTTGVLDHQTMWWHKMTSRTGENGGWTPIFASIFWYLVARWNILFAFTCNTLLYFSCIFMGMYEVMGGYLLQE